MGIEPVSFQSRLVGENHVTTTTTTSGIHKTALNATTATMSRNPFFVKDLPHVGKLWRGRRVQFVTSETKKRTVPKQQKDRADKFSPICAILTSLHFKIPQSAQPGGSVTRCRNKLWPIFPKRCQKIATTVFTSYLTLITIAQKVTTYLGYLSRQICCQECPIWSHFLTATPIHRRRIIRFLCHMAGPPKKVSHMG